MKAAPEAQKKFSNFSQWLDELLIKARIVDPRYPVKGFVVYRENGRKVLEKIRQMLEDLLHESGHEPVVFPVVIPEETFSKEAEHIKGFGAEVFWIERGGNTVLEKKLILRPTSETAMYPMFRYWIRSHADLPFRIHQSVYSYRYETKATRPLFRGREFPWNEAHTAHATMDEAENQVKKAVEMYSGVFRKLGLSYLLLKRPDFDKFAGAEYSIAFDAWNPDGKVNQLGTVHNLGRNFSEAFEIEFEDKDGSRSLVYQTCYGFGYSRTLAGVIAQHGDDHGCVFPPLVAPTQVVVIPIVFKGKEEDVLEHSRKVFDILRSRFKAALGDERDVTPGEKFYRWELLGTPVRAEVGPEEASTDTVTLVRRDTLARERTSLEEIVEKIEALFEEIEKNLAERSRAAMERMVVVCGTAQEVAKALAERKIARIEWCGEEGCAEKLKEEAGGEVRGTRADIDEEPKGNCIICGEKASAVAYMARAY